MRLNFFEHRTLFWSTNRQFFPDLAHFLWASSTWAIVRDNIKKIGHSEPFWTRFYQFSKKYPCSMRLNFFEHWTLFWSTNRQFLSDLAHFLWASSTWAIVRDNIKKNWAYRTILDTFLPIFQKSIRARWGLTFFDNRTLFWSPNRQFLSDLAHFLWACSTWAIVGDKMKKLGRANHFGHVFTDFQKSIRARWGLTFSNIELCFGQQIVNFGLIWFIFLWASSIWARVGDKIKKLGGASHFGHVFTDFQKIIRARWGLTFSKTEPCFGHQIVNFCPIWLIFCGQAPLEP